MLAGVPNLYLSRDEDPEEDLAEGGGRSSRDGRQSGRRRPRLLISLAAATIVALARPEPHRMVTRLLALVRVLAGVSAALTLAGAVVFAFGPDLARWCLLGSAVLSKGPALCVTQAWRVSRRGGTLERMQRVVNLSPCEQHLRYDAPPRRTDADFDVELACDLEAAPYPYDEAVRALGSDEP